MRHRAVVGMMSVADDFLGSAQFADATYHFTFTSDAFHLVSPILSVLYAQASKKSVLQEQENSSIAAGLQRAGGTRTRQVEGFVAVGDWE